MQPASLCVMQNGSSEKREVRQFQFTAWPDHGVPEYPTPFLAFLRRVKTCNPPDAGPIIAHCRSVCNLIHFCASKEPRSGSCTSRSPKNEVKPSIWKIPASVMQLLLGHCVSVSQQNGRLYLRTCYYRLRKTLYTTAYFLSQMTSVSSIFNWSQQPSL